ncbi:MAG: extracellular solute-binding protein [Deltaproteobacteria bacterium]|nr:MAG: extracellular solute-binding protein [Deltaproteobacteria bacterium]
MRRRSAVAEGRRAAGAGRRPRPAATVGRVLALAAALACAAGACAPRDADDAVVLWHSYTGAERDALDALARAFNADHDVKLRVVAVPYDAFADKITNAIPNGNGPDLVIFAHDRIGDWVAGGLIEPIEYFVDDELADRFAYDALAAMAYRGSLYGLPLAVKSIALFYRTDLVAEPPRTTDELLAVGRALTDRRAGRFGLVYENADLYGHAAWLHGFGGEVFDADGRLAIATPAAAAALAFARTLGGPDGIVPPGTTNTMVATLFNEGKAAMAMSGPWFLADIRAGVPWAVTSLPIVSATGRPAAPFLGAEGVLMSSRARDKRAAFEVMAYLTSDAAAIARARSARQVVPNRAAYDEPDIGGDPVLAAFRAQLAHSVPMPATPDMRVVWTPYKTGLQRVIEQGADPDEVLRDVEREVRGYLAGARRGDR